MSFEKMLPVFGIFLVGLIIAGIRYNIVIRKGEKEKNNDENNALNSTEPVFKEMGKKYKTWSIVNTCIFSVFILPILAIIESNKAQKAANQEEYDGHIRRAVIYNICTYVLLIPFVIIMKILESNGLVK